MCCEHRRSMSIVSAPRVPRFVTSESQRKESQYGRQKRPSLLHHLSLYQGGGGSVEIQTHARQRGL